MQRQKIASFYPAKLVGWLKNEIDIRQINRRKPILITCVFLEVQQKNIKDSMKGLGDGVLYVIMSYREEERFEC